MRCAFAMRSSEFCTSLQTGSFEQSPGRVFPPRMLTMSGSGERGDRQTALVKPCGQRKLSTFAMWSRAALMRKETRAG